MQRHLNFEWDKKWISNLRNVDNTYWYLYCDYGEPKKAANMIQKPVYINV